MKKMFALMLAAVLLLLITACGSEGPAQNRETQASQATEVTTEPTVPETVPEDGNPEDVTCKGTYTAETANTGARITSVGEETLTGGQLQVYYWMEVNSYRLSGGEVMPDFDRPLDTQVCPLDDTVNSWQQYFLKRAINTWHTGYALTRQGQEEGPPLEEAYQPNEKNHETYLLNKPATEDLYGYNKNYRPNEKHQAYLDGVEQLLADTAASLGYADADAMAAALTGGSAKELENYVLQHNNGYMFFTELSYHVAVSEEEIENRFAEKEEAYREAGITRDSGIYADLRHLMLVPENDTAEAWDAAQTQAETMLAEFLKPRDHSEPRFAELANAKSQDAGSALNGGLYSGLTKGQLCESLDAWTFDPARVSGDTAVVRSDLGVHILYFSKAEEIWHARVREELTGEKLAKIVADAREKYPMDKVDYSAITLPLAQEIPGLDLLYPDVAHERYPVVQLYLQQDYPTTKYGAFKLSSHGCGITTMAMVATYMTDTELTPPTMCERYDRYCFVSGTDGRLFSEAPAEMGFFLKERTYDWRVAKAAMQEGYLTVCVQHKGFWTRGGHYLVLEKMVEGDMIQVRDSNIFNYGRLHGHADDLFNFSTVVPNGMGYWIYQNKIVRIPACVRCGEEGSSELFVQDYYCAKCGQAMFRRAAYGDFCGA